MPTRFSSVATVLGTVSEAHISDNRAAQSSLVTMGRKGGPVKIQSVPRSSEPDFVTGLQPKIYFYSTFNLE